MTKHNIVLHDNEPCVKIKCTSKHCEKGYYGGQEEIKCNQCLDGYSYTPLTRNVEEAKELLKVHKPSSYEAYDHKRDSQKQGIIIDQCKEYFHAQSRLIHIELMESNPVLTKNK